MIRLNMRTVLNLLYCAHGIAIATAKKIQTLRGNRRTVLNIRTCEILRFFDEKLDLTLCWAILKCYHSRGMATFHIWQGDLYESWCTGDGPYRRVASASLGARELRATGTARKKLASRHPRRNEEEGHREILLKSALEQQLVPPPKNQPLPEA